MRYVVGVDGGGTKTTAVVLGEDRDIHGSATSGPANSRSAGAVAASANIAEAITAALHTAQVALADVATICLCLSGFDTDLDLPVSHSAVGLLGYSRPVIMENDVVGAWAGATEAQAGIVVISGTGSTALGMNAQGALWRADGWDYILGDFGSGFDIGRTGIRTAVRALDGRTAPTLLALELHTAFGVDDAEGMRRLADGGGLGKLEMAAFAEHVSRAADAGDVAARDILARAGNDLAEQAIAIIRRLGMEHDEFSIATVGSVFKSAPWVTEPFRRLVGQVAPRAIFRAPLHPPEVGAAILGLRRLAEG